MVAKMRKFELYIAPYHSYTGVIEPAEWGLMQKGVDFSDGEYDDNKNDPFGFATFQVKGGKFLSCFDIWLNDKQLNAAQNEPLFDEICEVEFIILENKPFIKQVSLKEALSMARNEFVKFESKRQRG